MGKFVPLCKNTLYLEKISLCPFLDLYVKTPFVPCANIAKYTNQHAIKIAAQDRIL